ncbi:LysR family transcriptional regulator [Rhizobium sp. RAF56]|uniref:LysR family transcriptional regulator n=1 Tax=Rhizobium sp. RAF56 TaxID=3233062 RepID=UPI003F9700E9
MDTIEALRLFVSIAETGSLSAAARLGSVATSTVTVALQQLEERAGASLITRSTRRLSFTHEGQQFLADSRRILADWDAAIVGARNGPLRGPIKITAPQEFSRDGLALIVDRFLLEHPAVKITLHFADEVVELVGHDVDVALRFGPLTDSTLMARLLLRGSRVVCASPAYWNERGVPQKPDDLTQHNCLVHARPDAPSAAWPFLVEGKPISVRVQGDRVANDSAPLREWALAGRGVIRRGALGIRRELSAGQLITALDVFSVGEANLYAVTTGHLLNQRVIAFVDFLEQQLLTANPTLR